MMRKKKNPRGLFERPPGSGVWWINYYVKGKQHREKVDASPTPLTSIKSAKPMLPLDVSCRTSALPRSSQFQS
jgi:hypothetical protein